MSSRFFNRTVQFLLDMVVLAAAYGFAYLVRFEGVLPAGYRARLFVTLPYVVLLNYVALLSFGVTRVSWRYFGLRDVGPAVRALAVSTGILLIGRFVTGELSDAIPGASFALVPFGIILVQATFAFLAVTGVRVVRRMVAERFESGARSAPRRAEIPTMLIGAGRAGVVVAKEIAGRPDLGLKPVGFLDDDPVKTGTVIHGIPVLGKPSQVATLAAKYGATQALITIAGASGSQIRTIIRHCEEARLPVKIIPGIYEIVGGTVNLSRIRDVAIEDLLRRDPVALDEESVRSATADRVVVVTGAGGSIGSELCRQVGRFAPKQLVLVEQAENALFNIERELRTLFPSLDIVPCIADICDARRMESIFATHAPAVVLHAAAHKHVPMMEANPGEAVKNNVFGTKLLADIADRHGVSEFVMISTDKAVNPTSVMGVSKRTAEIYIQAMAHRSKTRFVAVRFGNVLGSAGSVVPIFQEQIARGGPVTVTDPEMKRYFMTIPEASQLVLQAGALGRGGEIFVLDMGEPVKVVDLARDLITLSGLRPGEDIEIVFTGSRPGEKLFEELSTAEEHVDSTRHPKIFVGRVKPHAWEDVERQMIELERVVASGKADLVRDVFRRFVPEYGPTAGVTGESVRPPPVVVAPRSASKVASKSVVAMPEGG